MEAADWSTAASRLALALEYSPRFTEAWVNFGYVELSRGNFELARKNFARALRLNPDLPAPLHGLGYLDEKEGRRGDAERRYRSALKVDPGFGPARANLGRLLFDRGAIEEAREQFLRLTEVAPDALVAWTGLATSLLALGRHQDLEDVVRRARGRFGRTPELLLLVGRSQVERRRFDDAERTLTEVLFESDPAKAAPAWAWTAVARLGRGQWPGARDAALRALERQRDEPIALAALTQLQDLSAKEEVRRAKQEAE